MTAFLTRASTAAPVAAAMHSVWTRIGMQFVRKVLIAGISVLLIVTILFFIIKQLPGGEPLLNQKNLTERDQQTIIETYGLGKPLFTQFGDYLNGLFHGTFGLSMFIRPGVAVETFVWERIKWSVILGFIAIAAGVILALIFIFFVAFKINGVSDRVFTFLTALFTALPYFIFTTLLIIMASTNSSFPVLFEQTNFVSWLLPIAAVAIPIGFTDFWYIRSILVGLTNQQFVKFASIKGMTKARIVVKHLIPQSLLPMAIRLPLQLASSVTIILLVESIFGIPGAGQMLQSALGVKDYNIILAIFIVQAVLTAFAFPAQDLLIRLVDPNNRRR